METVNVHGSYHHHHHHHSHSVDDSEKEKNRRLSAAKRRKILGKVIFYLTFILASVIAAWVAWAYIEI